MKSKRPDGRSHWPRRKRRNDPGVSHAELRSLMAALRRLVWPPAVPERRWASLEDFPDAPAVDRLRGWVGENAG